MGILKKQEVCVAGMIFQVNFVVIRMEENDSPYPMLLGRPWFTQAKLKMDWEKCRITIKRCKKKIRLDMVLTTVLLVHARALHAEPINIANSVEDDEEEAFLQANESVIPVYDIDIVKIVEQYKADNQGEYDQQKEDQHGQKDKTELQDL